MTYEEAEKLRPEFLFLVGQNGARLTEYLVTDIAIVPLNNPDKVENISEGYVLLAELDADGQTQYEDISWYSDRKDYTSK